jgi:hypothetical protein
LAVLLAGIYVYDWIRAEKAKRQREELKKRKLLGKRLKRLQHAKRKDRKERPSEMKKRKLEQRTKRHRHGKTEFRNRKIKEE